MAAKAGDVRERLRGHRAVGIDTMVFIYHFEENPDYQPVTRSILELVEVGEIKDFERGTQRVLVGVLGDRNHSGVLAAASPTGPWGATGAGLEGRKVLSLASESSKTLAGTDHGIFVLDRAATTWRRRPACSVGDSATRAARWPNWSA